MASQQNKTFQELADVAADQIMRFVTSGGSIGMLRQAVRESLAPVFAAIVEQELRRVKLPIGWICPVCRTHSWSMCDPESPAAVRVPGDYTQFAECLFCLQYEELADLRNRLFLVQEAVKGL